MQERNAIGIDPDAQGFVCAYVKRSEARVATKGYMATDSDLKSFLKWVQGEGDVIIAIEGSNGWSKPLEKVLREAAVVFYSFKPADTDKFRKAVLGQNKTNRKDAESVARYAMALEAQGKLDQYRRVWFPDMDLQLLARSHKSLTEELTAKVNRLWKLLRYASPDLYLAFGGKNPEVQSSPRVLKNQGILNLLTSTPDVGQWKSLSDEQILEAMGGGEYKRRRAFVEQLRKVMGSFQPASEAMALLLRTSAEDIQRLKEELHGIGGMLEKLTAENAAVRELCAMKGIATNTASKMIAEIIDIRRFAREDSLACYSGLGMREHSTGQTTNMVSSELFNHRLKDAFMTAAKNFVNCNPESHIAGYYRNLVKAGMSRLEATKRVARALVRVIYRRLSALTAQPSETETKKSGEHHERGESVVASGLTRSGQSHVSNTPPSSPANNMERVTSRVKRETIRKRRTANPARRRPISKKIS
jgi:transposase